MFEDDCYQLAVYDCKALWHRLDKAGIALRSCVFDVSLAGYVLDSTASDYSVQRLAKAYLNVRSHDEADLIFRLWQQLSGLIEETGAHEIYYEIEHPCAFVLAEMEKKGFKVDVDGCAPIQKSSPAPPRRWPKRFISWPVSSSTSTRPSS